MERTEVLVCVNMLRRSWLSLKSCFPFFFLCPLFSLHRFFSHYFQGNQYSYRSAHILRNYRVDVDMDCNNKFGTLTRKLTANGGHYFSLVQETNEGSNILNMCCKTMTQRDNWVQHIEMAQYVVLAFFVFILLLIC